MTPAFAFALTFVLTGAGIALAVLVALRFASPKRITAAPGIFRLHIRSIPCASCHGPLQDGEKVVRAQDGAVAHLSCPAVAHLSRPRGP